MKVYKCDRCGNFFEEKKKRDGYNFYITTSPEVSNSWLDLCSTCNDELAEWFFNTKCMKGFWYKAESEET